MQCQKKVPEEVKNILREKKVEFAEIYYYAWPVLFRGDIGGCATFTVEAWVCDDSGPTVYICNGMYYFEDAKFKILNQVNEDDWRKME